MLAFVTGSVLLDFFLIVFGYPFWGAAAITALLLALGCDLKMRYWSRIDSADRTYTARGRDRARPSWHGAAARSAAHPAELS